MVVIRKHQINSVSGSGSVGGFSLVFLWELAFDVNAISQWCPANLLEEPHYKFLPLFSNFL